MITLGTRFGRLTVTAQVRKGDRHRAYVVVRCDCGSPLKTVRSDGLVSGSVLSCGCLMRQRARERAKHGQCGSPEYLAWGSMVQRCMNEKSAAFKYYGARGIAIVPEWLEFSRFLSDMGSRPKGTSLDRIDNMRGYGPDNCRWATRAEQMANTRATKIVSLRGERLPLSIAAVKLGLGFATPYYRMRKYGETPQQVIDHYVARQAA